MNKVLFSKIARYSILPLVILSVSLQADNDIQPTDCIFSTVLGTRATQSTISMKPGSKATMKDTECTLRTSKDNGDSDITGLQCTGNDDTAQSSNTYEDQLDINYTYNIQAPNTTAKPGGDNNITVNNNITTKFLTKNKYDTITQDHHHSNFTWTPTSNDIGVNNFGTDDHAKGILNTVLFKDIANKNLKIGQFTTDRYSHTKLLLLGIPNNIQINKLATKGSNKFTVRTVSASTPVSLSDSGSIPISSLSSSVAGLKANKRIDIKTLSLTSSAKTDLTLKAPTVVIGDMNLTNNKNNITIYADEIDIDKIDFGQNNTLTIHPYTKGKKVKFYSNTINTSAYTQISLDSGDYYVHNFNIHGSGEDNKALIKASDTKQTINLFVTNDLSIKNNVGINSAGTNGKYGKNPPDKFRVFVNGDVTTGGGGTTFNAIVYAEGNANLGSPTYIQGAISAENNISIGDRSEFVPSDLAEAGWGQCQASTILYSTGFFDAWEIPQNNALYEVVPPKKDDRNITTKIVNSDFNLTIASLNHANNAYQTKVSEGNVTVFIHSNESNTSISNDVAFDATQEDRKSPTTFNVTQADRNASVAFKFCATINNNTLTLHKQSECSSTPHDCNATSTSPELHICYSTDNFAIRPYSFRTFGGKQYKHAGEDFNVTIKGVDKANNDKNSGSASDVTGVSGYNADLNNNINITSSFYNPSDDDTRTMNQQAYDINDTNRTRVAYCPHEGTFTINNGSDTTFTNGVVNTPLKFSETGILDINISEKAGKEWAKVDEKDDNATQLYIKPATVIYDENDISKTDLLLFIPYKIVTTAEYNTTNGKNWLYIHDINGSNSSYSTPKMAAFIKYTITAKNKDGNTVENYTKSCFPDTSDSAPIVNTMKMNTTFDLFLDADINSSADANISLYTESNNSIAIYTPLKNKSLNVGNNHIQEWNSPLNFQNGVGKAKVYFNIDRNVSIARNPMTIRVLDANTSTSWMLNSDGTRDIHSPYFQGDDINQSKTFIYGRTHAPTQRFTGNSGNTFIYYEVYCNGTDDYNTTCNKAMLPNGVDSNSSDDPRWFINSIHQTANDGNIPEKLFQKGTSDTVTSATPTGANPDRVSLTYDKTQGYPYKTTMETNASSWLIYNRYDANATTNESQVEFIDGNASWSGAHETNTTTVKGGTSITNRRVMW